MISTRHPGLAFTTDTNSCSTTGTSCWNSMLKSDDTEPESRNSAPGRSVPSWIRNLLSLVRGALRHAIAEVKENPDNRLIRIRLSGDDPYWWILAGGIHVPGFASTTPN